MDRTPPRKKRPRSSKPLQRKQQNAENNKFMEYEKHYDLYKHSLEDLTIKLKKLSLPPKDEKLLVKVIEKINEMTIINGYDIEELFIQAWREGLSEESYHKIMDKVIEHLRPLPKLPIPHNLRL